MSTHTIGYYEDLTKIIFELSSNIIKYAPYFFCFKGCNTIGFSGQYFHFCKIIFFFIDVASVVPIVASYRKLVAVAKNRRQSIETFHYRLSELRYGSKCFRNIWFICGWLGSSERSNSILHLFSTYFKFNSYKIEAKNA